MASLPILSLPDANVRPLGTFWRPNGAFIDELASFLSGKRALEIFAGNGLLAAQLQARNVSVTPTSSFSGMDGSEFGIYTQVTELNAIEAVRCLGQAHDILLICWPTVTKRVIDAVRIWATDHGVSDAPDVVFIGEVTDYAKRHLGGCADDEFHASMIWHAEFKQYATQNVMERALAGRLGPSTQR